MKLIIKENQFGYLIKNGIFSELLKAGKYKFISFGNIEVKVVNAFGEVDNKDIPYDILIKNKEVSENISIIEIPDGFICLHFIDGLFKDVLMKKKYVFWNVFEKHTYQLIDMTKIEIENNFAKEYIKFIPKNLYEKIDVPNGFTTLIYIDNKLYSQLNTGIYYFWKYNSNITFLMLDTKEEIPENIIISETDILNNFVTFQVPDGYIGLHYVNNIFFNILIRGEHRYFDLEGKHKFKLINIQSPDVTDDMPKQLFEYVPSYLYKKIVVEDGETALLYYDNKYETSLASGTYYFWNYEKEITHKLFDLKLQQIEISGQEILTADKVSIRLNIICNYKIINPLEIMNKIDNLTKQLYIYTQLITREYIGRYKLDTLLEQKDEISQFIFEKLKEKQDDYYVEFYSAGIKDIILPGEIREIMNKVLIAEKTAQANVITRREEVASTRSLLNTAKLMEDNQILYKLKELEYLEKICEKVGTISVNGGNNLVSQLNELIGTK